MASYSSKSPSKALILLFIAALIAGFFNLSVIFNKQFLKIKETIQKEASLILDKNVYVRDIGFLPYGDIILKDIKIQDKETRLSYVEIEKLNIRFSIWEFLMNKNVTIKKRKKTEEFNLKGQAVFRKPGFIGPVKYKLNTIITPDVISIKGLFLDFEKFSIDIKGRINDYAVNPNAELSITSKEINFLGAAKINNLYSSIKLSKQELFVKKLEFFLNDFPLGLTCRISDFESPAIELHIMSYPGQLLSLRPFNPMNFELNYSGKKSGDSINGDLTAKTQKLVSINPRKISSAALTLDDISCVFSNSVVFMGIKNIICEIGSGNKLYLNAANFKTMVYLGKTRIYLTGLSVLAYKGIIKGTGFLDFNQWPAKLLLDFKVYKLDVSELARAIKLNYELKGSLDFQGVFNNRRDPSLSGRLNIKDGYLKNTQVLGMLSDYLSVPSLKDVYFEHISSLASLSLVNKEVIFDNITISDQTMDMSGNIKLKNTKKINGNISVRLSTQLLKESFKLRLLFFLIGEKLKYQNFEFEIGGSIGSPQIKWLSTRFRKNVMKYLTGSNRRAIEKALEKTIGELLPNN